MTDTHKNAIALGIFLILFGLSGLTCRSGAQDVDEPVSPWGYRFTNADRLLASQACVHEATWAGGTRTYDCGGILQVLMNRRHEEESFRSVVVRTMQRFTGGTTNRAWVLGLRASPIRSNPLGWPYEVPARVYTDEWLAAYARTQHFIDGEEPLPCSPEPTHWFGRDTDSEAIAFRLALGWSAAECGTVVADGMEHTTVNLFMYEEE